jgi:DeoR/GlpR family transcriptional regulator of sugar metabolism
MNDRQTRIAELLKQKGRVSLRELVKQFGVSEMTIRRDFRLLEERNVLTRTHGGSVAAHQISFDSFLGERARRHLEQKRAIASRAARLIELGDTIILDTGSTVFQLAHLLDGVANLTVATPSLAVASALFFSASAKLIVLGGYAKQWSPDLVGWLTEENIRNLHFRKAFLGADGIDANSGFFCNDLGSANVVKQIIRSSDTVYVLADSSKIGTRSLIRYAGFDAVDTLITNATDDSGLKELAKRVKTVAV